MTTIKHVEQPISIAEADILCEVYNIMVAHQRYPLVSELSGHDVGSQLSEEIQNLERRGILAITYYTRKVGRNDQRLVRFRRHNGCDHLRFPHIKFSSRNNHKPLTKKQAELLQYIYNYITKYGHSPSQREMFKEMGERSLGILLDKGIIQNSKTSLYNSNISRRCLRVSPGFGMDQLLGQPDILPRTLMMYEAICAELKKTTEDYVTKNHMVEVVHQKDIKRLLNELESLNYIRLIKKSGRNGYTHIYLGQKKLGLTGDHNHAPLMKRCIN